MMIQTETSYTEHTFKDLDMAQAHLKSSTFQECTFENCTFAETVFQNCRFTNCSFKGCDLSLVQMPNSSFSGTRFESTKLIGVNWAQAFWADKGIGNPLEFKKCALSHSTFLGINLGAIKLQRCEAINVDFREANVSQADFAFSDLKDSLFLSTNLCGADLRYARNYQIDPSHNNIHKAKFSLPEAMALLYSMDIEIIEP
jgi:fluoroquinolone resistance protein